MGFAPIGLLTYNQWRDRKQAITKVGLFTEEDHVRVNDNFLQIFVELLNWALMYKHFNKEEQMKYDKEMDWPEDYIDNARNMALDAAEKAVAEKSREVARKMKMKMKMKMKAKGAEANFIADCTGLTVEEVEAFL